MGGELRELHGSEAVRISFYHFSKNKTGTKFKIRIKFLQKRGFI